MSIKNTAKILLIMLLFTQSTPAMSVDVNSCDTVLKLCVSLTAAQDEQIGSLKKQNVELMSKLAESEQSSTSLTSVIFYIVLGGALGYAISR